MSVLNVNVSYFPGWNRPGKPHTVNLLTYLHSDKYRAAIERIRQTDDPTARKKLKDTLPGITPSGVFTYREENGLVQHSGFIAGDIDFKDNPFTPESIKRQVCKIQEVAYCGLSASGQGLWFLVPVANPVRHKEHFAALVADFAALGIRLDTAPANVVSFRFYSFDPDAYFNHEAKRYTKQMQSGPERYTAPKRPPATTDDGVKVEAILDQIEARRLDITGSYPTWFSIGCALASAFGESGRAYFHQASQFYPEYRTRDTDRQFSNCLRMKSNRYTLGTFFEMARKHGVEYKGKLGKN